MKIWNSFRVFCVAALLLPLQACGTSYSARAIEGWVVDAGTNQPLEGVNVVAHWILEFGLEGGQRTDLVLMESVTDKDGRYSFPAWGPVKVPSHLPWEARLKNQDPAIIIFKSGYWWAGLSNSITGPYSTFGPSVRTSEWDGKTIPLKKFEDSLDRYGSVVSGVLTGVSYGRCGWKKIPRIIVALDREKKRLQRMNVFSSPVSIQDLEYNAEREHCGSAVEFFKEFQR